MTVVDRIGSLQFDPLEVAGRNHDLVLLARIAGYRRAWTDALLYEERALFETYNKGLSLAPDGRAAVLPRIVGPRIRSARGRRFDEHAPLVDELLERIRTTGPMSSTDVEPRAAIDWYWRPTNQVRAILEALAEAGILGLARRDGNRRVYDLAERLFPRGAAGRSQPTPQRTVPAPAAVALPRPRAARASGSGRDLDGHVRPRGAGRETTCRLGVGTDGPPGGARGGGLHRRRSTSRASAAIRFVVAEELPMLDRRGARSRPASPPGGGRTGRRVPRAPRPARLGPRVPADAATASTTSGRSTSRPRSGAGATTSCRSCSATGSSGGSSRGSTGRPTRSGSSAPGGRTASTRSRRRGSSTRSPRRSRRTGRSAASSGSPGRGRPGCERSAWRSNGGWSDRAGGPLNGGRPGRRRQRLTTTAPVAAASVALAVDQAPQLPALSRAATRNSYVWPPAGRASSTSASCSIQTIVQAPPSRAPLDLVGVEAGRQDLERDVGAGPADGDALRGARRSGGDRRGRGLRLGAGPVRALDVDRRPDLLAVRARAPGRRRRSCSVVETTIALWPGEFEPLVVRRRRRTSRGSGSCSRR